MMKIAAVESLFLFNRLATTVERSVEIMEFLIGRPIMQHDIAPTLKYIRFIEPSWLKMMQAEYRDAPVDKENFGAVIAYYQKLSGYCLHPLTEGQMKDYDEFLKDNSLLNKLTPSNTIVLVTGH